MGGGVALFSHKRTPRTCCFYVHVIFEITLQIKSSNYAKVLNPLQKMPWWRFVLMVEMTLWDEHLYTKERFWSLVQSIIRGGRLGGILLTFLWMHWSFMHIADGSSQLKMPRKWRVMRNYYFSQIYVQSHTTNNLATFTPTTITKTMWLIIKVTIMLWLAVFVICLMLWFLVSKQTSW